MECVTCRTGVMSVIPLATHLDGQQHKTNTLRGGVRFICGLCHAAPFRSDEQWLREHVNSPVQRHKVAEEQMNFWVRRGRFRYAAPEEIERQIKFARERTSDHLRRLCWVLDGNKLKEYCNEE